MTQFVWLRVWPPLAIGRRGLAPQCSPALIVLITPMSVHSLSAFRFPLSVLPNRFQPAFSTPAPVIASTSPRRVVYFLCSVGLVFVKKLRNGRC